MPQSLIPISLGVIVIFSIGCSDRDARDEGASRPQGVGSPTSQSAGSLPQGGQSATSQPIRPLPPAVTWTNPPSAEERTSPGTEKFVAFVREPRPGDWNFMATVWEYIPSRPDQPMICRVHFEPSHWSPQLLGRSYAEMGSDLVRLQVHGDDPAGETRNNLYGLNYRTWEVVTHLRAWSLGPVGTTRDRAFISVTEFVGTRDHTLYILDRASGRLDIAPKHFERIQAFPGVWVIQFTGAPHGSFALFDPENNAVIREFNLPDYPQPRFDFPSYPAWSADQRYVAVYEDVTMPDKLPDSLVSIPMTGRYLIYDIEGGRRHIVPVRLFAYENSNYPAVFTGLDSWFTSAGEFRCLSASKEGEKLASLPVDRPAMEFFDILTVDPASGSASRMAHGAGEVPSPRPFSTAARLVPDYLAIEKTDGSVLKVDVIRAFLKLKGLRIEMDRHAWSLTEVGFSADDKRFFAKMTVGPESRDFFYGDLETKEFRRVKAPSEALAEAIDLEIECVITP